VIKTLYEIGKYICEKEGKDPLILSLREQFESFGATKELCIKLKEDNNKVSFIEIENPKEIDLENTGKYGIMQTEKRGANLILFFIFNGKVAKKIHQNRKKSTGKEVENVIVGFEDNFINFFDKNNKYYNVLRKNKEKICGRLLNIDYSTDKTENYLLTISINDKYPNEIEEFKSRLKERFFEKNINKSNGISYSDIKKCSICNKSNKLVGYLNLNENYAFFNFAGSNAKSIFARNYHTANAYKNNGICSECADYINFGSHYINNNLIFPDKTIGKERKKFFIFPLLYFSNADNTFKELISAVKKKFEKDKTISDKNKDYIEMWEELISEMNPDIQFNIIFISYEPGKQSREIIKSIHEVLPSRMMKILHDNKIVENELKSRIKNDNKYFFPLKVIWNIITHKDINNAESIKNYQYTEYLNFIASIFSENEKISYRFFQNLYNNYLTEIIQKYEKIDYAIFKILDVFYLDLFLFKIDIFYDKEETKLEFNKIKKGFYSEYSNAKYVEQYWEQFSEYSEFFNSYEKCFAFLMGRLTSETKYAREGKGSFIDGWLSNFSTNIYKLPQLMERCIETLSIENELLKKQNSIIAITSFFSKLISINKLEEFKDDLIFPFVAGFSFYYKIVFEKIEFKKFQENIDKLSNEEDKNFLLKCYKIDNESKYYILDKNISKEIRDKIRNLI